MSPRFAAALKDLGELYSRGGFLCPGDLQKIASRHSSGPVERSAMLEWLKQNLSTQVQPTG